jgi:glycosyltransferase involved in cell wall biosynthesis
MTNMNEFDLTIITISLNADQSLLNTFNSIDPLLSRGVNWIVVLTNKPHNIDYLKKAHLITGQDKNLYNALNIGLENLKTEYFMFIHSGDQLINFNGFVNSYNLIKDNNLDLVLGGSLIGNRVHLSKKWSPWMFNFHVQPPHLPIIYKTSFVASNKFNESIPVIADFYMLKDLFNLKPNFLHSGEVYISMQQGGLTSSGISSFFFVTKQFIKVNNNFTLTYLKSILRLIIKLIIK